MCQSKAEGGRRCPESPTTSVLRALRRRLRHAESTGNDIKAQLLAEQVTNLVAARQKYGAIVSPMRMDIPEGIETLLDDLRDAGGNPLLVGGTVRDVESGAIPKDFDIEVHEMSMDDLATSLRSKGYAVDLVGAQFGVIKTRAGGEEIDLSVPRKDSLSGVGHQGFTVETDGDMGVQEAAARRDFTINAMMYDNALGVCIDPYHGRDDLQAGVLRHVSDAFAEDPLRPLRGFQFAGRYGLALAPETAQMCQSLRPRYSEISKERIQIEWGKFFGKTNKPSAALGVLRQMKWDDTVPGLDTVDEEAIDRAAMMKVNADATDRAYFVSAVLASRMSDDQAREFFRATTEGDKPRKRAYVLSRTQAPESLDRPTVRKWAREIYKAGVSAADWSDKQTALDGTITAEHTNVLSALRREGVLNAAPTNALAGRDILAAYPHVKPGKWMGAMLAAAVEAQDQGEFTDHAGAMAWADKKLSSYFTE